jgi:hypothetical protein
MRVHILRNESVTPIQRYLERARGAPDSFPAQKECSALVLYREREYRTMFSSSLMAGAVPPRSPDSPFAPFDLTDAGADVLAAAATLNPSLRLPFDLFGLKPEAIDRLRRASRPIPSHAMGWLLLSRMLADCCRPDDASEAARVAAGLGDPVPALALLFAARADAGAADTELAAVERQAHAALRATGQPTVRWLTRFSETFEERVRQIAVRARVREEGERFTRYWTTELAYCESERADVMAGFDIERVPPHLRALEAVARRVGVGDDVCRGRFLRQLSTAERAALVRAVHAHAAAIDEWLEGLGGPPFVDEVAAYFWLLTAAEEIAPVRGERRPGRASQKPRRR